MVRRHGLLVVAVALIVVGILTAGVAMAGAKSRLIIAVKGTESMDPNALIYSSFHFDPGTLIVKSGDVIRLIKNEDTEEPHTLTLVQEAQLPTNVDQTFTCGGDPNAPCAQALAGHFPPNGQVVKRLDPDGDGGLNQPGDSILIFPPEHGAGISARITASPGTNLYFLCAFHPWMQGKIQVTG